MDVTLHIPDDLANRLGGNLSRRALEALAAEEYRNDRITKPELQRLLGMESDSALAAFLKAHAVGPEDVFEKIVGETIAADVPSSGMVEEDGLLVYRTGDPLPASVVNEAIRRSREDRLLHILGSLS